MNWITTANTNETVLISHEDYEWISQHEWKENNWGYVDRCYRGNGKTISISLHIAILNKMGFHDFERGDHRNRDPLDNRRENLRVATHSQNIFNSKMRENNSSGFRGVYYKNNNKWRAQITIKGEQFHLGYFKTPEEAYAAYKRAVKRNFGEFAPEYLELD